MFSRTLTILRPNPRTALGLALLTAGTPVCISQKVIPQPVTDGSVQASPLTPLPKAAVDDSAAQASPVDSRRTAGGRSIAPHTAIPIAIDAAIDSGKLKQGDNVQARLTAPVSVRGGPSLPAGTPVVLSVIETVPAGRIMAQGEFSLQVLRVGTLAVYTDTLVFDGKPGHQDLPDSAPALGTDAGLPNGAPLTFRVLPAPTSAINPPPQRAEGGPGAVNGTASGGPPPTTASNVRARSPNGAGGGNTPAQQQPAVSPGDTTTNQQTQHAQQPSVAPNQPQSPAQTTPSRTSQPR